MNKAVDFWGTVEKICRKDNRFKPEAYGFIMESLEFTIQRLDERRHVSAVELLRGFCDHAKERFGLLAHTVVTEWGIHSAEDVGKIVYYMVGAGVLEKLPEDRYEDFAQECDLKKILEDDYFG